MVDAKTATFELGTLNLTRSIPDHWGGNIDLDLGLGELRDIYRDKERHY